MYKKLLILISTIGILGACGAEKPLPPPVEVKITIPEGFSVREIDSRLAEMNLITPGAFFAIAAHQEGFLFPDTYNVYAQNFDPASLVKKMRENFEEKITAGLRAAAKKQGRALAEIITMASILEKEVKTAEDYPVVADILWKRLKNGWPLQADATLLYGKSSLTITKETLKENSKYNTYKYKGLPPTPIGNPGLITIEAAISPKSSPYWFYLTDKEGRVHYSKTNEEQNENRRKYLL